MSKKELLAGVASASALLATAASAADLAAAAHKEAAPAADDWSGFYAGISAGIFSGDEPASYPGSYEYVLTGSTVGAFAGFREDNGSGLVWGAELAYFAGVGAAQGANGDGDLMNYGLGGTLDAKVTAGVAMGNVLVYGFAGASVQNPRWEQPGYVAWGLNAGAGLEYKVTDHLSLGLEYTQRFMTGPNFDNDDYSFQSQNNSFALRASYSF